jgi:RNA polymerase sigma-70 factor (ECF subfamily)
MDAVPDDSAIIAALRGGDGAAFATLGKLHQATFLRIARVWVRNSSAAAEVVQAAWLAALEAIDRFEGRSALRTWLYGILVNVALSHARARDREVPMSSLAESEAAEGGPSVEPQRFFPLGHESAGHWSPGVLAPTNPFGGFLLKDIVLLGAALSTAAEALEAARLRKQWTPTP